MKNYAVIQHNYSEYLGAIEHQLELRDIGFSYFRPFVGQDLPGTAVHFDALFILAASWPLAEREKNPWVEAERRLVDIFLKADRPVVGIAYGGQLLAHHFGGEARPEPLHQAYWTRAHATEAGRGDPLAQAVDGRHVLVMVHGDVALPPGVEPILVDDEGRWIAARPHADAYALLFRPELKPGMLEDMVMEAGREVPEHIGELLAEFRARWDEAQETTDRVIVALVQALGLMKERKKPPVFHIKVE